MGLWIINEFLKWMKGISENVSRLIENKIMTGDNGVRNIGVTYIR